MKRELSVRVMLLIGAVALLASCVTTVMTNVWKDDRFTGQMKKAFVVGAFMEVNTRQLMENELAAQLKSRGVDAVPSHLYFSYSELADRKTVASKVRELGADSVIISRRLATEEVQPYVAGSAYMTGITTDDWDVHHLRAVTAPPPTAVDVAFVETRIFEVKTEKVVWSARSETVIEGSRKEIVGEFVKLVVGQLAADRLIR